MEKSEIIGLHNVGKSNRQIAKDLHIARNTINKYIKEFEEKNEELKVLNNNVEIATLQQEILSKSKMNCAGRMPRLFKGEMKDLFFNIIKLDNERNLKLGLNNKQKINGAIIYAELIRKGFHVSKSTVRKWYHNYKNSLPKEVFIKQQYLFGERIEFDFHVVNLLISGIKTKFYQATISCPTSNFIFVRLFEDQTRKSVLSALIEFFRYANGVPKEVVFDNLKPVVKTYGYKNEKKFTEEMIKFSTYYGFNIVACNARKGNEKGHVETSGDNARANLFALKYEFKNIDELNEYVKNSISLLNKDSTTKFEEEKKYLKELPIHDYAIGEFGISKADDTYCLVQIDKNRYSVPEDYIGKEIRYCIINDIIVFYYDNKEIARHKKIDGKYLYSINIRHYLKTLYKKPNAISHSLALKQADEQVIDIYQNKFSNDPKGFIEYLFGNVNENDIFSIEKASENQLNQINELITL